MTSGPADPMPVRLALISSSPLTLAGLENGLEGFAGMELVSSAAKVGDLTHQEWAMVDVAILDCSDLTSLPEAVMSDHKRLAWVLLVPADPVSTDSQSTDSPSGDAPTLFQALCNGCSILPRTSTLIRIAAAAQAAAAGLVSSTPALLGDIRRFEMASLTANDPNDQQLRLASFEALTRREQQVLGKLSEGLGNREIAETLNISPHTAKFHVAQIIAKLSASSRAHAVAKALQSGLLGKV